MFTCFGLISGFTWAKRLVKSYCLESSPPFGAWRRLYEILGRISSYFSVWTGFHDSAPLPHPLPKFTGVWTGPKVLDKFLLVLVALKLYC